jgi:hypothetical protein
MRFYCACFLRPGPPWARKPRDASAAGLKHEDRPLPAAATSASTIGLQSLLHLEGHDRGLAEPGPMMRTSPEGASPGQIKTTLTGAAPGEAAP